MTRTTRTLLAALTAVIVLLPAATVAQPVAGKQMRVILTYPPGGASDVMGVGQADP